ncbi:type II toxin-antitoxin system death-on-curing family toxin [Marisediminicola antarctica]|uniref:Death-on-curing protein n=1 Tax=Marisediminicola antarctica TaxID=674079 RepID=A0A7L5AL50_9MICO|nr:type II toxin-antitoxin system death-on-curing family toxin [Marisediminicola antarctica]QHO69861.1 death-on-curing protein [Marisediminicola antarctica]
MIYLTYADLLYIGQRTLGADMLIRDQGLLESALARPRASAFGKDAYESLNEKAAALTHSLARNHGLVDGNKRLSLAGLIALLGMHGRRLTWSNDEAYDFIVDVASGHLDDVPEIAGLIATGDEAR